MEQVKTGDILLFSSNSPTGFLLRTFTSSVWNHVGIAVRYILDKSGRCKIVEGREGKLCVLETNACKRYDPFLNEEVVGVGFSSFEYIKEKYNRIDVRMINDDIIPNHFPTKLTKFAKKYRGLRFPNRLSPFLSVWLGIEIIKKDPETIFCSELVAQYIVECLAEMIYDEYSGKLSNIIDKDLPENSNMYIPAHYDIEKAPIAKILKEQETIYISEADLWYVIIPPLLIILIVMLIIATWLSS